MSSISGDNAYHAHLRKQIREYQDILAATNPPQMILDTPTRRGHLSPGNTPYDAGQVFGGRRKKGLAQTLKHIGQFVKPLGKTLKPIKHALMERAVYELGAPMHARVSTHMAPEHIARPHEMTTEDLNLANINMGGRQHRQRKTGFAKFARTVGNFVKPLGKTINPVKRALADRAVHEIETAGGRQYRQKKTGFAKFARTVGNFVKPLGKTINPVKRALADRAVHEIQTADFGGTRGASPWIAEVKAMQAAHGVSYKEAMIMASAARHSAHGTTPAPRRTAEQKALTKERRALRKARHLVEM